MNHEPGWYFKLHLCALSLLCESETNDFTTIFCSHQQSMWWQEAFWLNVLTILFALIKEIIGNIYYLVAKTASK